MLSREQNNNHLNIEPLTGMKWSILIFLNYVAINIIKDSVPCCSLLTSCSIKLVNIQHLNQILSGHILNFDN